MFFSASAIFCFTCSTQAKRFFENFKPGNKKRVPQVRSDEYRGWRHRGHAVFAQKLLNTQHCAGRCACKSPIMKWANTFRVFQKNSLEPNAAFHTTTRPYTDTDGFLEHSPSGGKPVLQRAHPPEDMVILGSSLIFLQRRFQIVNRYMKRCSAPLIIREMQIKTTVRRSTYTC